MTITTLTSREFNQDTAGAKKAAEHGPVIITDRGRPAHVLLSIERYRELSGQGGNIVEQLGMAEGAGIRFTPPKARRIFRPADLG